MRYRVGEGCSLGTTKVTLKSITQGRAKGSKAGRVRGNGVGEKEAASLARSWAVRVSAVKLEALGRCEALWGKRNSALSMFSLSYWQNIQVEIACTQPGI